MKKQLLLILLSLLLVSTVSAKDGALFKIDIFQIENSTETNHLIYSDSFDIVVGKTITGFVGPFSLDIELLSSDSMKTIFTTHIITLGTGAKTYSKKFAVEYELPARIENIIGKNKSEYLLVLSPLSYKPNIELYCNYNHKNQKDFMFKPTAHTDIFYVPSSLGDFYFDSIKEILESNYRMFRDFLNLNIPGKIQIYVPPCAMNTVLWDRRFGTSVDPTRNTAYAIYNKDFTTIDPFIFNHTATLRTYGYTSPFLSEGLANYFSFAMYEMKKIVQEKRTIPLENLLTTYSYLKADATVADKTSTTFVRFLIDSYSLKSYMDAYEKADDINLAETLQEVYKKTIAELENEWLTYVDTFRIINESYLTYASSSEMMMRYDLMLEYSQTYLEKSRTSNDSLRAFFNLKRASFFNGNYSDAVKYQQALINILPEQRATEWMALGSYSLMAGENEKAYSYYQEALKLDDDNHLVKFNLSLYHHLTGDSEKAKEILLSNFSTIKGAATQGETRILLADIMANSKSDADKKSAKQYYQEAANLYMRLVQTNGNSSTGYMWLGKAFLGLAEYEKAINNLLIAQFIETRPFYLGMINLWLGKAYTATGDIKNAETYFGLVISSSSSAYHKKEAKELLKQLK